MSSAGSRKNRKVLPMPTDQDTIKHRNPQSINSKQPKGLGQSSDHKQDATSFYDDEFESFEESVEEEIEDQQVKNKTEQSIEQKNQDLKANHENKDGFLAVV
jgi:hypothetical protein